MIGPKVRELGLERLGEVVPAAEKSRKVILGVER